MSLTLHSTSSHLSLSGLYSIQSSHKTCLATMDEVWTQSLACVPSTGQSLEAIPSKALHTKCHQAKGRLDENVTVL